MQTLTLNACSALSAPLAAPQVQDKDQDNEDAPFGFVTPQRLIALGIVANALFWSGLLIPFNGHATAGIAFLHATVAMLGVALAMGGAVAVVMMVIHRVTVRLFSPELTAAVMHFTVVIAFATLSLCAALRGWNAGI